MNRKERRTIVRKYAKQIIALEKAVQEGADQQLAQEKMLALIADLTPEELLAIDEFIISKNKLTK